MGLARAATEILIRTAVTDIPRLSQASLDLRSYVFAAGAAAVAALHAELIAVHEGDIVCALVCGAGDDGIIDSRVEAR